MTKRDLLSINKVFKWSCYSFRQFW